MAGSGAAPRVLPLQAAPALQGDMRATIRPRYALLALFAATPATAQPPDPIAAIRADRWSDAQLAAASYADPVANKLVNYYRLLTPGAATADELTDFMAQNPDWPNQALLERRRQEAIAVEPDLASTLAQCDRNKLTLPQAMLHCAEVEANAGRTGEAERGGPPCLARRHHRSADRGGFPASAWSAALRHDDQWARFQHLAWRDAAAAERQVPRLDPAHRAMAEARLALQRDASNAETLRAALPAAARGDPGMVLDRTRWLRHADRTADALALWQRAGEAAQRDAPADQLAAFWTERNLLARRLLHDGNAAGAYALAADHGRSRQTGAGRRIPGRLHRPAPAERPGGRDAHFTALADLSKAAITHGRAHYWLGRAAAAAGKDPKPEYELAAAWPTTFYGQLAALALGDDPAALGRRITAVHDPAYSREQVLALHRPRGRPCGGHAGGMERSASCRAFLLRMDELAPTLRTGPDGPARAAPGPARHGGVRRPPDGPRRLGPARAGWPIAAEPPAEPVDPAVALGLIRQESSFDVGAVSPSGARGLMQLMPFTAQAVAKQIGTPTTLVSLTADPAHNMRLGTTYLREMLDRFSDSLPARGRRLQRRAASRRSVAAGEWRSARRAGRHDRLDRTDPVQRDPQLRAARAGERRGISGAAWRNHANPAGAMDAIVHRHFRLGRLPADCPRMA